MSNTNYHAYVRVSTNSQHTPKKGRSGALTQQYAIQNAIQKEFGNSIQTFTFEIGSAYNGASLKKLDKLIETSKKGSIIQVQCVSRFSRNINEGIEKINKLHRKGVLIYSTYEKVYSDDPLFIKLLEAAHNESLMMSKRAKDSYRRRIESGGFVGMVPFGYNIVRVSGVRKLIRNQKEQKIITEIKKIASEYRYKSTKLVARIAREFPGYKWSIYKIKRILSNYYAKKFEVVPLRKIKKN